MISDEDVARRAHLFRLVALLSAVVCALFAVAYVALGSPVAAIGPAGASLVSALVLWRAPQLHALSFVLTLPQLAGLTVSSWRFGGLEAPTLLWLPLPLVLAILVGRTRDIWVTLGATLGVPAALALLPARQDATPAIVSWMTLMNVGSVTVSAVLLAVSSERARRASTARLEAVNAALAQARDAANAANRAKSELMANVSHELRTPLHAVVGMADLLLKTSLDPRQQEHARTAREAAESLSHLLSDLLDASRIEAGAVMLAPTACDVDGVVRGAAALLQGRADARGLTLALDLAPSPGKLLCDGARLRQIVVNLVENAIKFTERGSVTVRVTYAPGAAGTVHTSLSVTDTGIGIAPEALPVIFERFRQGDSSTTRRHGGTGLGLSIARDLARLMGGTLAARSTPGQGSTFALDVDLQRAPAEPSLFLSGKRVLLVDDNAVNQRVAELMLQSLGCEVDVAADGVAAIRLATERRYDAVLLDCHMPEMDGYRAATIIQERVPAPPPILALTAASEDETARARAAGMVDVLRKPIDADRMRVALERVLAPGQPTHGQNPC